MDCSRFDILVGLVLTGRATEPQYAEFEEILKTSKEKQIAFEKLKRVWYANINDRNFNYYPQREDLWHRYQSHRISKNSWISQTTVFKIAAAILILLTFGYSIIYLNPEINTDPEPLVAAIVTKETKPGEKLKTWLPDGTVVILNSGSKLTYSENFTDSLRLVHLTGEGYFEIEEDKNRPFTVKIQSMEITALGTEFGVNAYDNNLNDQVALVSGKLLIKNNENTEVRMDSGQAISLSRENHSLSMSDINYIAQIGWKDGLLYFNNSSIEEIIKTLEMNYGVQFLFDKNLNRIREAYTGTFKNESLENVMKVISFSLNFKYNINGKKVTIETKK